jgi:PAS domain S-box-containing protein
METFTQGGLAKLYQMGRQWLRLLTGSSTTLWLPWLVLILGLVLTYTLWQDARSQTMQALEAEFEFWVNKVVFNIETRLNSHVQILRGVVGLFDVSNYVSRQDFRRYVTTLRLEERYAGIQGIGFAVAISNGDKAQHIAAIRQEGFPSYTIYPEGNRDLYTAIIYLEPFSGRNLRAFGYDMFSESVRRTAMMRARDQNQASLSGKVKLIQDGELDAQPGFLIYVPIYRRGAPLASLEERRSNLFGWAYSPLRMRDMMQSVMGTIEFDGLRSVLNVEMYDGPDLSSDTLLFTTDPKANSTKTTPKFQMVRSIEFGGHQWSIRLGSKPPFDNRLQGENANLIASTGSVGSLLLALLLGVLTASRARITRALRETAQSNKRLAASETQLRSIYDTSLVGIASCGADLRFIQVNHAFCELLEYPEAELAGLRTLSDVTYADEFESSQLLIEQMLERRIESDVIENRYVTKSGRLFSALTAARANYDEAGRLFEITIAALDIGERKQAEEALKASLEEKTVLLKEVHHRVKNNLQIISSLLNLQMDRAVLPDVLNPLRDTQNRVRSMALLHETLYRSGNLAQINLPDYIEGLCAQLWRSCGPATARVELNYQMDSVFLPLDQAVPCGLIINELVSNALKHAYPGERKGRIWVMVQVRASRQALLSVADDGIGLPHALDVSHTETLGLQLVSMLTKQLQGTITILRETRTEFQITFPIKVS